VKSFKINSKKYGVYTVLLDGADFERVTALGKWTLAKRDHTFYAVRTRGVGKGYLHNFILGLKGVDHINGNGLDNRRENLRPASDAQNRQNQCLRSNNTSGYRGVYWDKSRQKWAVQVDLGGRCQYAKRFDQLEDAVAASKRVRSELQPFCVEERLP
jgi:hypothetical protein